MIRYLCNVNSKPLLDMKSRYLPIMIVAVLLLSGCCSKQSKIDYIDKVIGKLDFNINPNAEYGFRSDFVDSFKLANKYFESLTISDLEDMALHHKNPVLRLRAFQKLVTRNDLNCYDIAMKNLEDTTSVMAMHYDFGYAEPLNSLEIDQLDTLLTRNKQAETKFRAKLDNRFMRDFTHEYFNYYQKMFMRVPKNAENYKLLRKHYLEGHNKYALVALAGYNNAQDTSLIEQALSAEFENYHSENLVCFGLQATQHWPDLAFKNEIYDLYEKEVLGKAHSDYAHEIMSVMMQYDDEQSYRLLEKGKKAKMKDEDAYYSFCVSLYFAYKDYGKLRYKNLLDWKVIAPVL